MQGDLDAALCITRPPGHHAGGPGGAFSGGCFINNVAELDMLMMHNRTYAATIGHSVSTRVRREIIARAEQLAVRVTNAAAKLRAEEDN